MGCCQVDDSPILGVTNMKRKIIIIMDGGLIQDIANIPDDIVIEVRDYDIEGTSLEEDELSEDSSGKQYIASQWSE